MKLNARILGGALLGIPLAFGLWTVGNRLGSGASEDLQQSDQSSTGARYYLALQCKQVHDHQVSLGREQTFKNTKGERDIMQVPEFTIMELNFENLFNRLSSRENIEPKPAWATAGVARMIKKGNPDILIGIELDNALAARRFNEEYLNKAYKEFLIEGNDQRGIDVAIFVKRDLKAMYEYRTHREMVEASAPGVKIFSRDIPTLVVKDLETGTALFAIAAVHLKSKRSTNGDPLGTNRRTQESNALAQIKRNLEAEFGEGFPVLASGDFNNVVLRSPEFAALRQEGFVDSFDVAEQGQPHSMRATHFYFPSRGQPEFLQIDGVLIPRTWAEQRLVREADIIPHLDETGRPLPPPRSFQERSRRPTDHYGTRVVIRNPFRK